MIVTKVNFALLLQDDFSGADLTELDFRFFVEEREVRPLKKPEGYYVFTGLTGQAFAVRITCANYLPHTVRIEPQRLDAAQPVVTVRLYRRLNRHAQDCAWVTGTAQENSPVLLLDEKLPCLKVQALEEQEGKSLLLVQSFTVQSLCRQTFCIGGTKPPEPFVVVQKNAKGAYLLDRRLSGGCKSGAPLCRAYRTVADASGAYALAVPKGEEERLAHTALFRNSAKRRP